MELSKAKNIIVLKGMASNVVEEAIVVLKPHVKIKQSEYNAKGKGLAEDKNKKLIVMREAENTINSYVRRLQKDTKKIEDKHLKMKYKFLQICNVVLILCLIFGALVTC